MVKCLHAKLLYTEKIQQSLCYGGSVPLLSLFKGKRLVIALHLRKDVDSDSSLEKVPS